MNEEDIKILENYLEDLDIMMAYDKNEKDINIKQALENLIQRNKELEEKYKRLSIEAQATAFDDKNKDTECLLRVLLKQDKISLDENGYYKRQDFDWEENMFILGLMKKREKTFYIPDDECLDEYTKQLESQLKEYNEIKKIFKKYLCFPNDTLYDGCCKMQDEIDKYKELQKVLNEKNIPIETLLAEFDRLEDIEDDRDCNYIPKSKVKEKIKDLKENNNGDDYNLINVIMILQGLLD